jgi:hypothetical protein
VAELKGDIPHGVKPKLVNLLHVEAHRCAMNDSSVRYSTAPSKSEPRDVS